MVHPERGRKPSILIEIMSIINLEDINDSDDCIEIYNHDDEEVLLGNCPSPKGDGDGKKSLKISDNGEANQNGTSRNRNRRRIIDDSDEDDLSSEGSDIENRNKNTNTVVSGEKKGVDAWDCDVCTFQNIASHMSCRYG